MLPSFNGNITTDHRNSAPRHPTVAFFRRKSMKQNVFNLYPVTNQNDLKISYRLVDVDGNLGSDAHDPDLAAKNLKLLAKNYPLRLFAAVRNHCLPWRPTDQLSDVIIN